MNLRDLGPGDPDPVIHWHLGVPVTPGQTPGSYTISLPEGPGIQLTMPSGQTTIYEASRQPLAGWRSPRYGELVPCRTLAHRLAPPGNREALTIFDLRGGMEESGHNLVGEEVEPWLTRFRNLASQIA